MRFFRDEDSDNIDYYSDWDSPTFRLFRDEGETYPDGHSKSNYKDDGDPKMFKD